MRRWVEPLCVYKRSQGSGFFNVWFPLTPALSPKERGNCIPSSQFASTLDLSERGQWRSLSPRERAGVRGKGAYGHPTRATLARDLADSRISMFWSVKE
jgi:hypothetical protein